MLIMLWSSHCAVGRKRMCVEPTPNLVSQALEMLLDAIEWKDLCAKYNVNPQYSQQKIIAELNDNLRTIYQSLSLNHKLGALSQDSDTEYMKKCLIAYFVYQGHGEKILQNIVRSQSKKAKQKQSQSSDISHTKADTLQADKSALELELNELQEQCKAEKGKKKEKIQKQIDKLQQQIKQIQQDIIDAQQASTAPATSIDATCDACACASTDVPVLTESPQETIDAIEEQEKVQNNEDADVTSQKSSKKHRKHKRK